MCGIIGYTGKRQAAPLLLTGLEQLEYRGYDSAGISVMHAGLCVRARATGYVSELRKVVSTKDIKGTAGIAHTRWATHGAPLEKNAHPHTDAQGQFHVVHNGIIENHQSLRAALPASIQYSSDTDTEVIAHLLSEAYRKSHSVEGAFTEVVSQLSGSYGLAVVCVHEPERIYIAKRASPLLVGIGTGETYVSSDIVPLIGMAHHAIYLKDGELGWITPTEVHIQTIMGNPVQQEQHPVPEASLASSKGVYAHYMQKEMHEAPHVIQAAMKNRLHAGVIRPLFPELQVVKEKWLRCNHLRVVACGTSYHAALYGKYVIEAVAHIPVTVEIASEFRYRTYLPVADEIVVGVSQSGETADTYAALMLARDRGVPTIGIVNVEGSTIARGVDACVLLRAGPEMSVASTKACIGQSVIFAMLALSRATDEGIATSLSDSLSQLAARATETLEKNINRDALNEFKEAQTVFCLGRGGEYSVAMEAALKLKEVAYIHAEGYPGGELKHGSLALIDVTVPTLAFLSEDETLRSKLISNIAEIRSREGRVTVVSSEKLSEADAHISIPKTSVYVAPILHTMIAHLVSYHIGCMRGTPIDKPRNLAKAVTVE